MSLRLSAVVIVGILLFSPGCCGNHVSDEAIVALFTAHRAEIESLAAELEAERLTSNGSDTSQCWTQPIRETPVRVGMGGRLCKQLSQARREELTGAIRRLGALQARVDADVMNIRLSEDCKGDKGLERRTASPHPLVTDLDHPERRLAEEDFLYRHLDGPWYIYLARDF